MSSAHLPVTDLYHGEFGESLGGGNAIVQGKVHDFSLLDGGPAAKIFPALARVSLLAGYKREWRVPLSKSCSAPRD